MTDAVPLSDLPAGEKSVRSSSFGAVAETYERFRPGPCDEAVDWLVPDGCGRVVDLGAGTGALTRLLVPRAAEVIAVEPDDRMRAVLSAEVPGATALAGRGEDIPVEDATCSAVLASSSWHWMDAAATLAEAARVLLPGGTLGAVWTGPDPDGEFMSNARALIGGGADRGLTDVMVTDAGRPPSVLSLVPGAPFTEVEHLEFYFDVPLNADELVGLMRTMSAIITLSEERREAAVAEARRLLREFLGIEGDVTVDITFKADAYRTFRSAT
jgi:SAM-dependent methyltransferase